MEVEALVGSANLAETYYTKAFVHTVGASLGPELV